MSSRKADPNYRFDGMTVRQLAKSSNRIADMLRKQRETQDSMPAPVLLKEPKK